MNYDRKSDEQASRADGQLEMNGAAIDAELGPELQAALQDFKSSVHEWSDAAYTRPRTLTKEVRRRSWRVAAGWAMGCLLVAGSLSGGLIQHRHHLEAARVAAAQRAADQAEQQRLAALDLASKQSSKQSAGDDEEDLLAQVDSAVSRQVPNALDPLAQMMAEDETK